MYLYLLVLHKLWRKEFILPLRLRKHLEIKPIFMVKKKKKTTPCQSFAYNMRKPQNSKWSVLKLSSRCEDWSSESEQLLSFFPSQFIHEKCSPNLNPPLMPDFVCSTAWSVPMGVSDNWKSGNSTSDVFLCSVPQQFCYGVFGIVCFLSIPCYFNFQYFDKLKSK